MVKEIFNIDYTPFIGLLGTAHFTQRSILDASQAVKQTGTQDLAIELDPKRFTVLNRLCISCPRNRCCSSKCEFVVASEVLGNIDANIWLIDMSEIEIAQRIHRLQRYDYTHYIDPNLEDIADDELPWLWEHDYKKEVLRRSTKRLKTLQRTGSPTWRVLIEERNALMAARLTEIASRDLEKNEQPNVLALVGAAHVEGISSFLQNPSIIPSVLKRLDLPYSPPTMIRRVHVENLEKPYYGSN